MKQEHSQLQVLSGYLRTLNSAGVDGPCAGSPSELSLDGCAGDTAPCGQMEYVVDIYGSGRGEPVSVWMGFSAWGYPFPSPEEPGPPPATGLVQASRLLPH